MENVNKSFVTAGIKGIKKSTAHSEWQEKLQCKIKLTANEGEG